MHEFTFVPPSLTLEETHAGSVRLWKMLRYALVCMMSAETCLGD